MFFDSDQKKPTTALQRELAGRRSDMKPEKKPSDAFSASHYRPPVSRSIWCQLVETSARAKANPRCRKASGKKHTHTHGRVKYVLGWNGAGRRDELLPGHCDVQNMFMAFSCFLFSSTNGPHLAKKCILLLALCCAIDVARKRIQPHATPLPHAQCQYSCVEECWALTQTYR